MKRFLFFIVEIRAQIDSLSSHVYQQAEPVKKQLLAYYFKLSTINHTLLKIVIK